jgi:type 1 glutamine amidotransferase/nicotinamidase-related amidase
VVNKRPYRRISLREPRSGAAALLLAFLFLHSAPAWDGMNSVLLAESPLSLVARDRVKSDNGPFAVRHRRLEWQPKETALVICDMWDDHWCKASAARVAELAPAMNALVAKARERGVLIIHSPSDTMGFYKEHPARARAQAAPRAANVPADIGRWCRLIAEREGPLPIDDSDGGCDGPPPGPRTHPWTRQIERLAIDAARDLVSDSGEEIWNAMEARGIQNVLFMGVHTNICVLGRPFGIRNLVRAKKNVLLVRDMTDTMYNPQRPPHVTHVRGTDLVVEHIERHWCPSVTSDQIVGGRPFRFAEDKRRRVVLAVSEPEYDTAKTLPKFAEELARAQPGLQTLLVHGDPERHAMVGLAEALRGSDLLLLSIRRQALPSGELAAIREHLAAGKPLVGIRTASHAFDARRENPSGHEQWLAFDREVLAGNYSGHHGVGPKTTITAAAGAAEHPILSGVKLPLVSNASLYKVSPLAASATPLLIGAIPDRPSEPVAWTNQFGKSRIFYTSLGHRDDFADPAFGKLLSNGILWALGED